MALELNAITSSVNGSNSDSNDVTDGMAFETSNNHSSSRNDLEFLDDQQRWQRTISRSRGNIKHKPTYVSIFASDPDCSSPLFDKFDQRFSTSRPKFLNGTLHLPSEHEETRSATSIVAPLIRPSRQSISPLYRNTDVLVDSTETSKQIYLKELQPFSAFPASMLQQEQQSKLSRSIPEPSTQRKLHGSAEPFSINSSRESSNSNRSAREISAQKNTDLENENTSDVKERGGKKSEASVRNDQCSRFQNAKNYWSPDSGCGSLLENAWTESGDASSQQSRPRHRGFASLRNHDSYNGSIEGPQLQILSYGPEFEMTLLKKPGNQRVEIKQCVLCDKNLDFPFSSEDNSSTETHSNIEKNPIASFLPVTKLKQVVSQRSESLKDHNGGGKSTSSVIQKPYPAVPNKSTPSTSESSAVLNSKKAEHFQDVDRTASINKLQTTSNEKLEKPEPPALRRTRDDDDKPISFSKLVEKFTKADNGAVPTPKTFQITTGPYDSKRPKSVRNNRHSDASRVATRNSQKVDGNLTMNNKFIARCTAYDGTSRYKSSTAESASVSRTENSFAKVRASFEKTAELLVTLASHTDNEEFEENIKKEKSSKISRQSEVEQKFLITKQKESVEVYSSLEQKKSNAKYQSETGSPVWTMKGLDFSRFDNVTNNDVIGRLLETNEVEVPLQKIKEITSSSELQEKGQLSEIELMECKSALADQFANYEIFKVILKRSASNPEGSVGVILSSAASGDQFISVQRVISGSTADRSDFIEKGDRVFFVQGHSTRQMLAAEARTLIKQRTEYVVFILGRLKTQTSDISAEPAKFVSTSTVDPDLFDYSTDPEEVILTKGSLGVGLALDGGRGSVFGDRPIVIKRVFEGGSAARSGRVKVGDQVVTIDGISMKGMSYLEATKTLRSRPEGPLNLVILRRL